MRALLLILLACMPAPAVAADAATAPVQSPAFDIALPAAAMVDTALHATPGVLEAEARLAGARAERTRLRVGPNEYVVSGLVQGRREGPTGADFVEGQIELSRTLRAGDKARLDLQAGELGESAAADGVADARHQAARSLAELWFAWIEATATAALDRDTVAAFRKESDGLRRRIELRDAAQIELDQSLAALAASEARAAQSLGATREWSLALAARFPELVLPANPPALPDPPDLVPAPAAWRELVLLRSHEVRIAETEAQRQRALAARSRLDRKPDVTVGVRAFSERGGRENGIGLFLSRPLGGAYRSATADAEAARASVAEIAAARVRREVSELASRDVAAVETSRAAWRASQTAALAAETAAARTRRAYDLGERDVADALLAERQAHDARRAEVGARAAAWRTLTLLRVDAHDLWAEHHDD